MPFHFLTPPHLLLIFTLILFSYATRYFSAMLSPMIAFIIYFSYLLLPPYYCRCPERRHSIIFERLSFTMLLPMMLLLFRLAAIFIYKDYYRLFRLRLSYLFHIHLHIFRFLSSFVLYAHFPPPFRHLRHSHAHTLSALIIHYIRAILSFPYVYFMLYYIHAIIYTYFFTHTLDFSIGFCNSFSLLHFLFLSSFSASSSHSFVILVSASSLRFLQASLPTQ